MWKKNKCILLAFCAGLIFHSPSFGETLTLSSPPIPPVSGTGAQPGYLKEIVVEAGKRVGLDIQFTNKPAQRSLFASNAGQTDGELHRIAGLEKYYPNLVRIPEAVLVDQFVGFSRMPDLYIKDWADTGDLKIAYPRGWTIYANAFGEDRNHLPGLDAKSLFKMTAVGRIDIAMHTLDKGSFIAHTMGLNLYPVTPPLAVKPMYIYLHKSKSKWIGKLSGALADVKKDGTYARIKRRVLHDHGLSGDAYFDSPLQLGPDS